MSWPSSHCQPSLENGVWQPQIVKSISTMDMTIPILLQMLGPILTFANITTVTFQPTQSKLNLTIQLMDFQAFLKIQGIQGFPEDIHAVSNGSLWGEWWLVFLDCQDWKPLCSRMGLFVPDQEWNRSNWYVFKKKALRQPIMVDIHKCALFYSDTTWFFRREIIQSLEWFLSSHDHQCEWYNVYILCFGSHHTSVAGMFLFTIQILVYIGMHSLHADWRYWGSVQ